MTENRDDCYKTPLSPGGGLAPSQQAISTQAEVAYGTFAAELGRLDGLIVLPYAAGEAFTAADIHMVAWLAHAMMACGIQEMGDLDAFERWIAKSVAGFRLGGRIREWWALVIRRESIRTLYPKPH